MTLQIRNPRALELAARIGRRRQVSLTEAVLQALEAENGQLASAQPLAKRLGIIADERAALAKPVGQDVTKDEIDAMWGLP